MGDLEIVWDESKNARNSKKHGVAFEEAQTVFYDGNSIEFFDPEHSRDEDRFLMLGLSIKLRVLRATRHEAESYWEGRL